MKTIEIEIRLDTEDFISNGCCMDAVLRAKYVRDYGDYGSNETARPPYLEVEGLEITDNNNQNITSRIKEAIIEDLIERYCI